MLVAAEDFVADERADEKLCLAGKRGGVDDDFLRRFQIRADGADRVFAAGEREDALACELLAIPVKVEEVQELALHDRKRAFMELHGFERLFEDDGLNPFLAEGPIIRVERLVLWIGERGDAGKMRGMDAFDVEAQGYRSGRRKIGRIISDLVPRRMVLQADSCPAIIFVMRVEDEDAAIGLVNNVPEHASCEIALAPACGCGDEDVMGKYFVAGKGDVDVQYF